MEAWRALIVLIVLSSAAVRSTPVINQLPPGQDWPTKYSVKQPNTPEENVEGEIMSPETPPEVIDVDDYEDESFIQARSDQENKKVDYSGAQLWKVNTNKTRTKTIINRLKRRNLLTTWASNSTYMDILVKPSGVENVTRVFRRENITYEVIIDDIQERILAENPPMTEENNELENRKGHRMTWSQYHRISDIHGFLDYLAKTYPAIISVQSIGKSHENRDLKLLKISNGNANNRKIFIDGGIHAREWISPATVTYFISQIAENFDVESEDVQNTDWYFLPVINPDGYEYTHTTDRFWRKNRRPGRWCYGVDLNRNFGYRWGGKGTSSNACSEIYRGSSPFSEPESKAVSNFIKNSGVNFTSYLSYHSYGQYILYPWGYDNDLTDDHQDLDDLGNRMAQAIHDSGKSSYQVGSASRTLYPAAGGSDDWAKAQGIKYAFTVELSDTGKHGFVLPAEYILPVARESMAGLRVVLAQMNRK